MKSKQYKVTLLSDIVLNASLATEGNIESLDYLSGSNFLGIVAKDYANFKDTAIDVFHNGKVKFGNAYISKDSKRFFPMSSSIMKPKDEKKYPEQFYLGHRVDHSDSTILELQLKQQRAGYLAQDGTFVKDIGKTFALKSAHNAIERRSDKGKMFGFESLKKGSEFIFNINYADEKFISKIEEALVGTKRLGKSKSAEFGLVKIDTISMPSKISSFESNGFILIYAASNLCFIDEETGQPTLKPSVFQLPGQKAGSIDWSKSSIRTYTYSPYNGCRKTTSVQRDCIAKGSVFYINELSLNETDDNEFYVGEYQAEGLGHVIINPIFLDTRDNGQLKLKINELKLNGYVNLEKMDTNEKKPISPLGLRLLSMEKSKQAELAKSKCINNIIKEIKKSDIASGKQSHPFSRITSSQWGAIRQMAENPNPNSRLYSDIENFISKGVASEKYWDKDAGKAREQFLDIIKEKDSIFIVKLTSEIAKHVNSFKSKKN